jgi:hypothetical protein
MRPRRRRIRLVTATRTPARRRALQLAALATTVAVGLAASGVAAPGHPGGTSAARAAARRDVAALLPRLQLPPGAVAVLATTPLGAGAVLPSPPIVPATPNVATSRAYWSVPGTPADLIAFVAVHPPAGGHRSLAGTAGGPGAPTATFLGFSFPANRLLATRSLAITVAADGPARTVVLALAADVWLTIRAATERVPRTAVVVTVRIYPPRGGGPPARLYFVVAPALLHRLIAAVDRLPAYQPGVRACPADNGSHVDLDFRAVGGGLDVALVRAQSSGCGAVRFDLSGRPRPALGDGQGLTAAVERILGG